MKRVWPQLVEKQLNTVIGAVSWELIEPQEGKFDFSTVDDFITDARQNHIKVVFLWFGSWKNGLSSYQPFWVKTDPKRFPWVKNSAGKTLDILSTFSDATRDADLQDPPAPAPFRRPPTLFLSPICANVIVNFYTCGRVAGPAGFI